MEHAPALKAAFDLMHLPSQVRHVREAPLPRDISLLLRIAASDDEATDLGVRISGRSRQAVREAAAFFIEQIMLFPDADNYRVLGTTQGASNEELRRNMALLLRWLHPDMHNSRSIFAGRVTRAWNELKNADRRAAYDLNLRRIQAAKSMQKKKPERSGQGQGAGSRGQSAGNRNQGHGPRSQNQSPRPRPSPHGGSRMGTAHARRPPGFLDRLLFLLLGRPVH